MNEVYATRLADLVLTKGVNLQKGQPLMISVGYESYPYARVMAQRAYKHGAKYVYISLTDAHINAARCNYLEKEDLEFYPHFLKSLNFESISENWAKVRIDSGEERIVQPEFDMDKMQILSKTARMNSKEVSERTMRNEMSWCVTCCPGPLWAKQLLGDDKTEDDLWEVLAPILKIENDDFAASWEQFDIKVKERRARLNSLGIKSLHYKSSVTDFTMGFRKEATFEGGAGKLSDGRDFFPNLPTEELFTTPDMMIADGYITTTRPVTVLDRQTEEVTLFFKDGLVVDCKAKVGQEVMDAYLNIDKGARRIGECALVDESSPIAQSGIVFGSILIDENASCHIALGAGYPECLSNTANLRTDEELNSVGCNTSLVHTDFMVGSKDLDITATLYSGEVVKIMEQGNFVF